MASDDNRNIFCIRSLLPIHTPRGCSWRIEDIVVDKSYRRQGIGMEIITRLIRKARDIEATTIRLTSNSSRKEANALYRSVGFEPHKTNSYQYNLLGTG